MIFMVFLVLFGINAAKCTGITKIDDLLLNLSADLNYQIYRIPQGHVNSICWTKREGSDCLEVIFTILYPTSTSCGPSGERALKTIHLGMFLVTQTALHFGLEELEFVGVTVIGFPTPLPCTDFPQNYHMLRFFCIHKRIPTQYRKTIMTPGPGVLLLLLQVGSDSWRTLVFRSSVPDLNWTKHPPSVSGVGDFELEDFHTNLFVRRFEMRW